MQQQPSSLVFVAIVVGWAVYLLPQWVRRREALGQFRGRDRHSAGLRVLDRRPRAAGGPSSSPLLPDPRTVGDPVVGPLALGGARGAAERVGPSATDGRVGAAGPDGTTGSAERIGASGGGAPTAVALAAQRRARVLSALLGVTATCWAAALVLPGARVAGWASTLLLGTDVAALVIAGRRRAVRRARAERARRHRLDQARRRQQAQRRARPDRPVGPAGSAGSAGSAVVAALGATPAAPIAVQGGVPSVRLERASERVARELSEGGPASAWTPVPVPPPTYTLKPAVPRPDPAPLDLPASPPPQPTEPAASVPAETARTPRPWDDDRSFADDLDLDAVLARRRAVNG